LSFSCRSKKWDRNIQVFILFFIETMKVIRFVYYCLNKCAYKSNVYFCRNCLQLIFIFLSISSCRLDKMNARIGIKPLNIVSDFIEKLIFLDFRKSPITLFSGLSYFWSFKFYSDYAFYFWMVALRVLFSKRMLFYESDLTVY